jgi:hypothetical protein
MSDPLLQFFADIEADLCPHCSSPLERQEKVGRSVYAKPCGCRLWQGDVVTKQSIQDWRVRYLIYQGGVSDDSA